MSSTHHQQQQNTSVGPRAKCDQVIYEAICKGCEIIIHSRMGNTTTTTNTSTTASTASTASSTGNSNATTTSRFNLQIPEIVGVRNILSQYRLQLHVPIRLDVYYQNNEIDVTDNDGNNNKELLERWCLEYTAHPQNSSLERFVQRENVISNDPMVQLTHICKRIVIWLRTLYCYTRLLPSQQIVSPTANIISNSSNSVTSNISSKAKIGFSIYVNTDYNNNDVNDLITNYGFTASQFGSVVTTLYGELSWKVVYSPQSKLEKMNIPNFCRSNTRYRSVVPRSKPIPMIPVQQQQQLHHHHDPDSTTTTTFAPRSAPLHISHRSSSLTYSERSQQKMMEAAAAATTNPTAATAQQSFQNNDYYNRTSSTGGKSYEPQRQLHYLSQKQHQQQQSQQQAQQHHHPSIIQRSQTTICTKSGSNSNISYPNRLLSSPPLHVQHGNKHTTTPVNNDQPPSRVMSGLSLALLNSSNDDDIHTMGNRLATASIQDGNDDKSNKAQEASAEGISAMGASSLPRRAALHQMPPHLLQQHLLQSPSISSTARTSVTPTPTPLSIGDYGYGYNNHIPWQKIHPSQTNPMPIYHQQQDQQQTFGHPYPISRTLSSSPHLTAAMSPLLSTTGSSVDTNTPPGVFFRSSNSPSIGSHFIPPRNYTSGSHRGSFNNNTSTGMDGGKPMITPPFQSRPVGFLHDPPSLFLEPTTMQDHHQASRTYEELDGTNTIGNQQERHSSKLKASTVPSQPPVTSLDILRNSPFQQQQSLMQDTSTGVGSDNTTSFLSLLNNTIPPPLTTGIESDYLTARMSFTSTSANMMLFASEAPILQGSLCGQRSNTNSGGSSCTVLPSSLTGLGGRHYSYLHRDDNNSDDRYSEEMPFALELPTPSILDGVSSGISSSKGNDSTKASSKGNIGASSTFGTSSTLASLAQKCSVPNQRLKMFDKKHTKNNADCNANNLTSGTAARMDSDISSKIDDPSISLANQLEEYRAFGASLSSSMLHTNNFATNSTVMVDDHNNSTSGLSGSGTSTSTPISLRS